MRATQQFISSWHFSLLLVAVVMIFIVGCAGQKPPLKDEAVKPLPAENAVHDATQEQSKDKSKERYQDRDKVFVDSTGKYTIVRTPFGYVKRPIRTQEPEAEAAELTPRVASPPPTPEAKPAVPPAAPSVETTRPTPPPAKAICISASNAWGALKPVPQVSRNCVKVLSL